MRQRLLDLLVGLAVGGLVGGTLTALRWQETLAQTYLFHTAEQAVVATRIAKGEAEEVAGKIRAALPGYAQAIEGQFSERPERCWVLWQVRKAYEAAGAPFPDSVRTLLEGLPPEASCPGPPSPAGAPGH